MVTSYTLTTVGHISWQSSSKFMECWSIAGCIALKIQIASWVPPCSIFIFWLNGLFGTVGISRFFSIFLCNFYSYLNFLHSESQFHIVPSRSKFKVLLIIVWFQIVLSVWTNQRPENRVMTNISVKRELICSISNTTSDSVLICLITCKSPINLLQWVRHYWEL